MRATSARNSEGMRESSRSTSGDSLTPLPPVGDLRCSGGRPPAAPAAPAAKGVAGTPPGAAAASAERPPEDDRMVESMAGTAATNFCAFASCK